MMMQDIKVGGWHLINLLEAPFKLAAPVEMVVEKGRTPPALLPPAPDPASALAPAPAPAPAPSTTTCSSLLLLYVLLR